MVLVLAEGDEADPGVVPPASDGHRALASVIIRGALVSGADRRVVRAAVKIRVVEVIEGREREEHTVLCGVSPGEVEEAVALGLIVADAVGLLLWPVGNLVFVPAAGADDAKLVGGRQVVDHGAEAAESPGLVVECFRRRSLEAELGKISAEASEVGKALGVAADAELIVRGVVAAVAGDEFAFVVALESGARDDVEGAV